MEPWQRLKSARERAGFESAADAARAFGWSEITYRHHENGTRNIPKPRALTYARGLRVSPEWLMFGTQDATRKAVPLVGHVGAGAQIFSIDDGDLDEIEPPPGIGPSAVAVLVRGSSMYPRYFDGDLLIYDGHVTPAQASGQECVVSLMDGRKLVKVVRFRAGAVTLESYNAPPIENL